MIDLKKLTASDEAQVRHVWKTCFQDSDAFLDAYFSACVQIENGLGFFENGRLLSHLFSFPVRAVISGMVYPAQFIAGCATLPEARNQHLMRDLIEAALTEMADKNFAVCFLHPFLHSFYAHFGFETVAYVDRQAASADAAAVTRTVRHASSLTELPFDALYASYGAYVTQFGNYFIRSEDRMKAWLSLLFADGGRALYIDGEENTPYALYYNVSGQTGPVSDIFELISFDDAQLTSLVNAPENPASFFTPARGRHPGDDQDSRSTEPYTMMRILNPKLILQSYRYPEKTPPFVINIHDKFLQRDHNLLVSPGIKTTVSDVEMPSDIITDVAGLTRLFTGIYDPAEFPQAAHIFSGGSSCYFETY